ncbi:MAG: hypothetical protein ACYDEX_13885 [Mobilitalea sp.]
MNKKIISAIIALYSAATALVVVFMSAAVIWILITNRDFSNYFFVLSRVMRNGGTYSALLVAIVVAVAFQSFKDAEAKHKESEEKIKQIGQYTIAFQLEEKQDQPVKTCGDIIAIKNEEDYLFENREDQSQKEFCVFPIQFLTSGVVSTNLQCIMAFEDEYLNKNKKEIISNYYSCCERLNLQNPLYCAARQTNPNLECETRNRFVNLFLHLPKNDGYSFIWFSAITDQGFLLFIKVKLKTSTFEKRHHCRLISQFSFAVENGKLKPLYY